MLHQHSESGLPVRQWRSIVIMKRRAAAAEEQKKIIKKKKKKRKKKKKEEEEGVSDEINCYCYSYYCEGMSV